jgi:hypothetical protein
VGRCGDEYDRRTTEGKEKQVSILKQHETAIKDLSELHTQLTDLQRREIEGLDLSKLTPEDRQSLERLCQKMGVTRTEVIAEAKVQS